jgi:hypothetical protein
VPFREIRLERAGDLRETAPEVPFVSRPELDTRFRPNSDGSIAFELYFVLSGRTHWQLLDGEAEHRLNETRAGAFHRFQCYHGYAFGSLGGTFRRQGARKIARILEPSLTLWGASGRR